MKVVGIIPTSFVAKDTGERIEGVNIHGEYKPHAGTGVATTKFFLTKAKCERLCPDLTIGSEIEPIRGKDGKISRIMFLG